MISKLKTISYVAKMIQLSRRKRKVKYMGSSPNFDKLSTDKQLAIKELVVLLMFAGNEGGQTANNYSQKAQ